MVLAYLLFGFICLYAVLVAVGCTQLQKLHISLTDLKQLQEEPHYDIHSHLKQCVELHQKIIR